MVSAPDDGGDYVSFNFYVEREDWQDWKEQVPREKALHDRLSELIQADAAADGELVERTLADAPEIDDMQTLNLLRLKLGRCHARATVASDRLRDDNVQQALVTVDKIIDIAEPFARET